MGAGCHIPTQNASVSCVTLDCRITLRGILEEAAKRQAQEHSNKDCHSGTFREIHPQLTWSLTFNGGVVSGLRMDGICSLNLSRNGDTLEWCHHL